MNEILFSKKIPSWDEALPLGNGQLGCLVWDEKPLKFSIDRVDLWDTTPSPQSIRGDFTYETLLHVIETGNEEKMNSLFDDCYNNITPTKILGGRIELAIGGSIDNIFYKLDMVRALATINMTVDGKNVLIETFVDAHSNAGLIRISGTEDIKIEIVRPDYGSSDAQKVKTGTAVGVNYGNVNDLHYPLAEVWDEDCRKGFVQPTNQDFKYGLLTAISHNEDHMLIAYSIISGKKSDCFTETEKHLNRLLEIGFDETLSKHVQWWNDYNNRSKIVLSDNTLQHLWDTSTYLLACNSRKGFYPMPLQGVFTADDGRLPPWKGDYHNDLNTQMSYSSYLKANHLEQGENFIDFLLSLKESFCDFAKSFFDADNAISIPGVMDIDGKPMGGWPMYSLNLTNSIWICRNIEDYYNYTLKEGFLENKLYPFMRGVSRSIERWLKEDKNTGTLMLPLSSSPEVHNNTLNACFLNSNTNYDVMLMRYLYEKLACYAEKLGVADEAQHFKNILERLPQYSADETGYTIAPGERLAESHRHFSHLMAIYPLRTIPYNEENREVIDRSIAHLENLGYSYWAGFSFTWMAELYTITGNGEGAACMLKLFADYLCLPNGFHCNGDYKHSGITALRYRPFTLESNMAAMSALQDMLMSDQDGIIEVFPAIPESLAQKGVSFEKLRAMGAVLVSSSIKNGQVDHITLNAVARGTFKIKSPFREALVQKKSEEVVHRFDCDQNNYILITLKPEETARISLL